MLTLEKTESSPAKTVSKTGNALGPEGVPALALKYKLDMDGYKQEEYFNGSYGDITLRMVKKLVRLLGRYSIENEGRLSKDIISLIEHEIKKGHENDLMRKPYMNRLDLNKTGAVYKIIYMATKNVLLEFGNLMDEGAIEHKAKIEHKDSEISKEMRKEEAMIWVLNMELRRLEVILKSETFMHLINVELHDTLLYYIEILRQDIDKFEDAHGLAKGSKMNPEASKTPPE
ncbi:MAG: hypothetical protein NTY68_02545 [Candidatus Micrarchaeota archaeon]|nr:hypothetical protein [Candidatus Micrarchaeota archaeon]